MTMSLLTNKPGLQAVLKLIFIVTLLIVNISVHAQVALFTESDAREIIDINSLSESELERYLATLTDKESRELLLKQLQHSKSSEEKSEESTEAFSSIAIMALQSKSEEIENQFHKILTAAGSYKASLRESIDILFNIEGVGAIPRILATLILILLLGVLAATLVFGSLRGFRKRLYQTGNLTVSTSLSRIGIGLLHDVLKIALFMGLSISLTFLFFEKHDPIRILASTIVILVASLWLVKAVLNEFLYSPLAKNMFFTSEVDRKLYYWFSLGFFVPSFISLYSSGLLVLLNFPLELVRLNGIVLATMALWSLIIGVAVYARLYSKRLDTMVQREQRTGIQINWYWPLVLVFVLIWLSVLHKIVIAPEFPGGRFYYFAILLLIVYPLYSRLIQLMMAPQVFASDIGRVLDYGPVADGGEPRIEPLETNRFLWLFFSIPYVGLIVLCILEGLGFRVLSKMGGSSGTFFWRSILEVVVAIFLGTVSWNAVKNYVNKNLPDISVDPEALMDSEGGGSDVATRTQTLLPILRNFFLFVIVLTVTLIVLSSLGINTAPLLAGAGVVGIAIGFGAQKLVQDIVSGMFFLIEDAFRIGEYIESDAMVGTVESTSIRSLKLRHHLGPVQTVPYSEIRAVKNHSRDFIIMKLKFRVPFDTDIEVVRKTIKKVGQELLQHEELGPDFIAPLKSQGVLHVEDDALMMRMKFTAKPGKQWVIRREAYRLVKEALEAKEINFAQRQVTVHISDKLNTEQQQKEIVGAATEMAHKEGLKAQGPVDPMADM